MIYKPGKNCQISGLPKLYHDAWGDNVDGTFVEVGAYNGVDFSNTNFLANIGWKGYYIEPVPNFFNKCVKNHAQNNVECFNTAIGSYTGQIDMWVCLAESTCCAKTKKIVNKGGKKITVPITTLDKFLEEQQIQPGFELLVVDVENWEPEVFKAFDLDYWRPQMAIVETHDKERWAEFKPQMQTVIDRFADQYTLIYEDKINSVWRVKDA